MGATRQHLFGSSKVRTAIIGTGLAGLTTAHLLHNDKQEQFVVTLLEQGDSLSFDSASVAVKNNDTGRVERIDLPMRASAGGYYANLNRMYRYLGIPMHSIQFLFVFARALKQDAAMTDAQPPESSPSATASTICGGYFVHSSNHHRIFPPRPASYGLIRYLFEALYLVLCHVWFMAAWILLPPRKYTAKDKTKAEAFADYLERIWLPRRYITHYILPLMSSVSTCTHAQVLAFPASDLVHYMSFNQWHYTICGGVHQVQSRLVGGIQDVRLGCRVLQVSPRPATSDVLVRWQARDPAAPERVVHEEIFDRVILAVSPDVAGRLFAPVQSVFAKIPTCRVESSVLAPSNAPSSYSCAEAEHGAVEACMHHSANSEAAAVQVIALRTQFAGTESRSEAIHHMPSGVVVTTCPLEESDTKRTLKTAVFTRTLRTVESRAVVEELMGRGVSKEKAGWVNGEDNVWLTGAWCWDGMVLLEGCVVSAMRVAEDLGVEVPWKKSAG